MFLMVMKVTAFPLRFMALYILRDGCQDRVASLEMEAVCSSRAFVSPTLNLKTFHPPPPHAVRRRDLTVPICTSVAGQVVASLVVAGRSTVRPPAWNNSAPIGRILMKLDI
jgi:hypothetical protein